MFLASCRLPASSALVFDFASAGDTSTQSILKFEDDNKLCNYSPRNVHRIVILNNLLKRQWFSGKMKHSQWTFVPRNVASPRVRFPAGAGENMT